MAAPTNESTTTNSDGSNSTTFTFDVPDDDADIDAGDVFVGILGASRDYSTLPTDWTLIDEDHDGVTGNVVLGAWYEATGSSEPNDHDGTLGSAGRHCSATFQLRGAADPDSDPPTGTMYNGYSLTSSPDPPSHSMSSGDYFEIALVYSYDDTTTASAAPSGFGNLGNIDDGWNRNLAYADQSETSVSSIDPGAFTLGASEYCKMGTVVIPGSAGGGGSTVTAAVDDTISFTDTTTNTARRQGVVADTLALDDTVTNRAVLVAAVADSLSFVDTPTNRANLLAAVADTLSLTDTVTGSVAGSGTETGAAEDTLTFTDTASATVRVSANVDDSLAFGDSVTNRAARVAIVQDTLTLDDAADVAARFGVSVDDVLSLADQVSPGEGPLVICAYYTHMSDADTPVAAAITDEQAAQAAITDTVAEFAIMSDADVAVLATISDADTAVSASLLC